MKNKDISKLLSGYLKNTGSDHRLLELNELRQPIDNLTAAFNSSSQTYQKKLLVTALSVLANHLRLNDVQADTLKLLSCLVSMLACLSQRKCLWWSDPLRISEISF